MSNLLVALSVVMRGVQAAVAGDGTIGERDGLVRQSLHHLHAEQFEAALASAGELKQRWPASAAGYLAAANVYQTMMRDYRVRAYEEPFRSNLRRALAHADREVRSSPSAATFFVRGTALAYQAANRFTCGDPLRGVLDAVRGVADARKAAKMDAAFADPVLLVAVFDFWRSEKLGLGLGLFGGGRRTVVSRLERVRTEARFLSVEAAYALQTVHYLQGEYTEALAVNEWLRARFPSNPVALYHRGMILERLGRDADSLPSWDALATRLHAFPHRSDGFLAECSLHRARLLARTGRAAEAPAALERARGYVARRIAAREMEGPLVRFEDVARQIHSDGRAR